MLANSWGDFLTPVTHFHFFLLHYIEYDITNNYLNSYSHSLYLKRKNNFGNFKIPADDHVNVRYCISTVNQKRGKGIICEAFVKENAKDRQSKYKRKLNHYKTYPYLLK